jgi:transposase InsO family protein
MEPIMYDADTRDPVAIERDVIKGCLVTRVVTGPATEPDQRRLLFGKVAHADNGALVGSFCAADVTDQTGWHLVLPDGQTVPVMDERDAVERLTNRFGPYRRR